MTSAEGGRRGGTPKADESSDKLCEYENDKWEGVHNLKFCGSPMYMPPYPDQSFGPNPILQLFSISYCTLN